ncbi:MAG TPA: pectinesterase family protein [Thermoanaerobaculia bacterium]|nr:pectinesterase family protein [Thermoanaerobaculia bacterium]
MAARAEVILFADYSDPDVIRVGDHYYLVASSFQAVPGLPILESPDLVHWTLIGHAVERLPDSALCPPPSALCPPQHGNGMWAPSIRHHDGWFWIYVGDPDRGIYMTRAREARGPWEPLTLVKAAKGWIDPCPLWDDDGNVYLVHAWAKSRAGFNGVLTVNKLTSDGRAVVDEGVVVFDGRERHPTIEGPKFYKRNGWYYIFAPAGGVKRGWQTVLRSKSVYGPYEDRVAFDEPGMHQGGWVDDWFVHFQDRGAYGRIVHRSALRWVNDWPEISGAAGFSPPSFRRAEARRSTIGLEWQWQGNPSKDFYSIRNGKLRLSNTPANLWDAPNILLQKFPAPAFTATVTVDPRPLKAGERAGLVVMGTEYSAITIERRRNGFVVQRDGIEAAVTKFPLQLQVTIAPQAVARFSYDGKPLGKPFVARPGKWVGAKVGIFGRADFENFRMEPFEPAENASLVVAQDGSGDFRTIQEAVDTIPAGNDEWQIILIRNGVYREKVLLAKSYVALVGEDREQTRIEFAELRRNWRASHPDDYGAAVINVADGATDIILANLTVLNDYGRKNGGEDDHQFAIRSLGTANRIAVLHANVIADGGDTFSPWNHEAGLTYATDSYFEGHVDYVCPRGWAYITNSRFFGRNLNASLWHDGSRDRDQKFVVRHSRFDGVPNFPLGRHHRDAQFYLVDVSFSANMADRAIYAAAAPDAVQWGERIYYASARRDGGDFSWFADNLQGVRDEDITAAWTFGDRWDPASLPPVLPFASIPRPENGWRFVDPAGVTLHWTPARNAKQERVELDGRILEGRETGPLEPGKTYTWRVNDGPVWSFRADPRSTRIALVGDSTVTEKSGWGRGFKSFVAESAALLNAARGGRSSKSYRAEGHWEEVLRRRPTHILLQFGHNDEPGKGADRETDLPTFRANMARYVDDARAIGAQPILVTSLPRRYDDPVLGAYAAATRQVALEKSVLLIDLYEKAQAFGDPSIGPLKTDGTVDRTHLNAEGSAIIGALMANEVRNTVASLGPHIRPAKVRRPNGAWSARMADAVMKRNPDATTVDGNRWEYTPGLVMKAIFEVAQRTGEKKYWDYAKSYYDGFIAADGTIRGGYKKEDYNIDRINPGKPLFLLYEKTKDEKYRKAIEQLRQQMREHPRTSEGGFWHKQRYPWQMWLDGLYMGAPFLAQYAKTFKEPALFDDVITQFVLMEKHARDDKTGLLYHGWDEKRQQKWADPKTGRSPAFWGRAMGWYAMGLVETLDSVPLDHPRRGELIAILQRLAEAVTKVQDPKTGVWWQVVDQPNREGNYLEASVSTMLAFALLKSTRLGYIDPKYRANARRAYDGILKQFIEVDSDGVVNITKVCAVAGLGGDPEKGERYRAGTFDYYVSEPVRSNDPKAVGPFIFLSLEMEH